MRIDNLGADQYLNRTYNNIPSQDRISKVGQNVPNNNKEADAAAAGQDSEVKEPVRQAPRANASIGNVALSLGNRDSSLIGLGNISGISTNVMKNAVSQMQKDSILHEYQYFVGSGIDNVHARNNQDPAVLTDDEDGVVIRKS